MLNFTRLPGPFGAEIRDFDLRRAEEADIRELVAALHEHRAIVIRGQQLTPDEFCRYGGWLGRPHAHVLRHGALDGYPIITVINNEADNPRLNGAAYWHTDNSYEPVPASATTLYAVAIPPWGGETLVADMVTAYEALPASMKQRIDGLTAVHLYGNRDAGKPGEYAAAKPTDEQWKTLARVRHPLVLRHPVTGRKALYGVSGTSRGIDGMDEDEAVALLGELKAHATRPEFTVTIDYRVGDVAAWDTLATLHAGKPQPPSHDAASLRRLLRISVKGVSPYAAPVTAQAATA
jgi:taurine dioxygenase